MSDRADGSATTPGPVATIDTDPSRKANRDSRTGSHLVAAVLAQEMRRDADIVVFGEDVAGLGGVFGSTRRLAREFGDRRVFDTPVSETAFVGMAVGAGQAGLRPVVEIMFADFAGVCFDQIANEMAKARYMSGGEVRVPLVVRAAAGSIGSAAQHSQLLTATFAHIPGLKVVVPGSHGDLQRLLVTAIRDDDPVIFLEHKRLLKTRSADVPLGDALLAGTEVQSQPFGTLRRVAPGTDITIVATGWMVQEAVAASTALAGHGISAGVVDLRTVVPLDREGLLREAGAAPALLVVDEDYTRFGTASEVIAVLAEGLGTAMPRVARYGLDVSLPASRVLEEAVLPGRDSIVARVTDLLAAS